MKKAKKILANTMVAGALVIQGAISNAQTGTTGSPSSNSASEEAIRPSHVHIPESDLVDLRQRILATKWPDKETVNDASQGVKLENLKALAHYWGTDYNWRKAEAKLNALPQFTTKIDSLDIYFIHVRSKEPNALPLLITHGWPGSVFEFLKVIGPLTNPTAYGGKAEDAFDVVIPALPGFGFSGKPAGPGWDPDHIARAWAELMKRLGYKHYVAQGGDWGAPVTNAMARQAPAGLLGIHLNLPATVPPEVAMALASGTPPPGLTDKERQVFEALVLNNKKGNLTYFAMMTARPQAVGYGLMDSPAGLAAFLLVHPGFQHWTFGKDPQQSPTKDDVLDDFTLYWVTNSATSSARLYWENAGRNVVVAAAQKTSEVSLPVAITVFPEDVYLPPETWARRAYSNLIYFHEADKGGHIAAWEQPELFSAEIRAAFRSLRNLKSASLGSLKIFYREAGDPSKPTIILLHGFPSSSYEFNDLIPRLADRFHVIAPDYPGMGFSDAPSPDTLRPTFDDMALTIYEFITQRVSGPMILYMHDIGGPIGMRIATAHPDQIAGLIFQNTVISVDGWDPARLKLYEQVSAPETPEKMAQIGQFTTVARDKILHQTGAHRPEALDPNIWLIDNYAFSIEASRVFMSRLFMDLTESVQHYPKWNEYLKDKQPKTLVLWGRNDPLFIPTAPELVKQVLPTARLRYFEGGHFALDEYAKEFAEEIIGIFS